MELRILCGGARRGGIERVDDPPANGRGGAGGQPHDPVLVAEAKLIGERCHAERRRHAVPDQAQPGGENVAEAGDEQLLEARANDSALRRQVQVARGKSLQTVIHLPRAHV